MNAPQSADRLDAAVRRALAKGARTADIAGDGQVVLSTQAMTDAILRELDEAE